MYIDASICKSGSKLMEYKISFRPHLSEMMLSYLKFNTDLLPLNMQFETGRSVKGHSFVCPSGNFG